MPIPGFTRHFMLITLLFCLSCASLVDKGNELYEQQLYDEAADFYARALQADPNDIEAKVGLSRARNKIIDRGLIEVRMLRLANNKQGAVERLETILRNQLEWRLQAQGAIAATQAEEMKYAKTWLIEEVKQLAKAATPDQYQWFRYAYRHLIDNAQIADTLAKYEPSIISKGQAKCQALSQYVQGQRFFLAEFLQKYCGMWSFNQKFSLDNTDQSRFLHPEVSNRIRFRSDRETASITHNLVNSLADRLAKNIWFSNQSQQVMAVVLQGQVSYQHRVKHAPRSITYTDTVTITDENNQTRQVNREQKHRYVVKEHRESIALSLQGIAQPTSQQVVYSVNNTKEHYSESHGERFEKASLYPKTAKLFQKQPWLTKELDTLINGLMAALNQHWERRYCKTLYNNPGQNAEYLIRCGQLRVDHPSVKAWSENTFGLSFHQIKTLIN